MRMNYRTYPTDYVNELNKKGIRGRKKARAFMEYWNDMEYGEFFSIGFYARSWDVSKSTAHEWIKEFNDEIDLFLNHWTLKNKQHYNSVQKQTERIERSQPNESNAQEARNYGDFEKSTERIERSQPNEVFNIYDDNNIGRMQFDKHFGDLFFLYRMNTKYGGKKEEAYKEWLKIKDLIDIDQLKRAAILYLHDPHIEKKYNLANFLKNEVYLSYMPKRIKIKIKGEWKVGTYDDKEQVFFADDGYKGLLPPERLAELFAKGDLEFVR